MNTYGLPMLVPDSSTRSSHFSPLFEVSSTRPTSTATTPAPSGQRRPSTPRRVRAGAEGTSVPTVTLRLAVSAVSMPAGQGAVAVLITKRQVWPSASGPDCQVKRVAKEETKITTKLGPTAPPGRPSPCSPLPPGAPAVGGAPEQQGLSGTPDGQGFGHWALATGCIHRASSDRWRKGKLQGLDMRTWQTTMLLAGLAVAAIAANWENGLYSDS